MTQRQGSYFRRIFGGISSLFSNNDAAMESDNELDFTPETHPHNSLCERYGASPGMELRDPLTEIFDEGDRLLIVAEMPGIQSDEVELEVNGRDLTITAHHGNRCYRKVIQLPYPVALRDLTRYYCNNILEIHCPKISPP